MGILLHKRTSDGKTVEYDLSKLEIAGVRADAMTREQLFGNLRKLKVPGVEIHMGSQQLLEIFVEHLSGVVVA